MKADWRCFSSNHINQEKSICILENDLLEAIIALPNDIFYNTGIATYIWVLSNKKAGTVREGKVQLINAA